MSSSLNLRDAEAAANEQSFRQLAEAIGAVFRLMEVSEGQMIYISPGYKEIWGRESENLYGSTRAWFDAIHAEDRDRILEAALSVHTQGGYDEEYRIVRPDGSIRWIRDRACPILNQAGEVYRIAGIAEDITGRKLLEKQVIEINDRERSNLGQDLHDGICQQLVSIAFATDLLRKDLAARSPGEAVRASKISSLLDNAISQARHLSHALSPVKLSGDGLSVALKTLAGSVSRSGVSCGAECSESVFIQDHAVATHLYRIAQEAVENATKFTNSTQIWIKLSQERDTIFLTVSDNGTSANGEVKRNFGIGLNIIKFRTDMAGGRLQVLDNPKAGTTIVCSFQQAPAKPAPAAPDTDFTVTDDDKLNLDIA